MSPTVTICLIAICTTIVLAALIVARALPKPPFHVKVYMDDINAKPQEPPKPLTKPPTVHLSDAEIKARREAMKGNTFGP